MSGTAAVEETRIVVGIDGSGSAQAALHWALRQAKLTGSRVEAVTAWHYPSTYGLDESGTYNDFEGDAHLLLSQALAAADGAEPSVTVLPLIAEGHPADVLLQAAKGAELLVLGSRGHSGFTSALMGSVSLHCMLHAHCPVLVLHGKAAES